MKTQLKLCFRFLSRVGYKANFEVSAGHSVVPALMENYESFSHLLPPDTASLYCVKWTQIFGTRYSEGMVVVPKLDSEHPIFGQIKYIFSEPTKISFVLRLYSTTCFSEKFQAYEVQEDRECCR